LPFLILCGFFLELAVMIAVGRQIGVLATLLLVIGAGILGTGVIRSAGLRMAGALRRPAMNRAFATRDAAAGFLYLLAGMLLILPGFVSDVVALLLLPTVVRRWLAGKLIKSFKGSVEVQTTRRGGSARPPGPVIEGEAVEIDDEPGDGRLTGRDSGPR
jgi:UPF0716 protein FxsA